MEMTMDPIKYKTKEEREKMIFDIVGKFINKDRKKDNDNMLKNLGLKLKN